MILQRPGTSIRVLVESTKWLPKDEQVYVEIKVLERGDQMWMAGLTEASLTSFELGRRSIGRFITKIDGLKTSPNEPWEMSKDSDGFLTNEAAEFLFPITGELCSMILDGSKLTPVDRKNS